MRPFQTAVAPHSESNLASLFLPLCDVRVGIVSYVTHAVHDTFWKKASATRKGL